MAPMWNAQEEVCYYWRLNYVYSGVKAICWWADHVNKAVWARTARLAPLILRRFLIQA